jgi:Domain of Unknown Function with PDB structure (DUF3857)
MYFFNARKGKFVAFVFFLSLITFSQNSFAQDWQPISGGDLAMKTPKVEADADAEALMWEVYVADEPNDSTGPKTILRHYIRIKIFTERGRENNSKVDIPFGKIASLGLNIKVQDITARTIKPDGSTIELNSKDIFERDILKANRVKLRAKSFALPGIEVGSIIEYRWKEIRPTYLYDRFQIGRDIPVQQIRYHIKPLNHPYLGMRIMTFNGQNTPWEKEKSGFHLTTFADVPAYKEEPRMPEEYSVKPWMLVYYSEDTKLDPKKFWQEHGKSVYDKYKSAMKPNDEVKKATMEAVGDAAEPMQKIERIFNFVRAKVKNINDDASGLTPDQIKAIKENKNAGDVLKRGIGDWMDIDLLFASMVSAAGFETRIANLPRRSDMNFNPNFADDYFMRTSNVAVKIGEEWKYFDPGSRYIPFGMLSWEEEGQPTLVSDSKNPTWNKTQYSPAAKSLERRSGKFKLLEDGTLEGEATIEFTGHVSVLHKEYNDNLTQTQREDALKDLVKSNILGSAEISDPVVENASDPDKPIIYRFKVRVPGYTVRTGKRIFLQPNVFERNASPMFTAGTRRYDISLNYAWSENDDISIELPKGFSLESPDSPAPVKDTQGIGEDVIKMSISKDGRTLYYKRNFSFGNNGLLYFQSKSYQAVKTLFEAFHKANTHQITLKQDAAQATSTVTKEN